MTAGCVQATTIAMASSSSSCSSSTSSSSPCSSSYALLPPRLLSNDIEMSVHRCSKLMLREIHYIFPHLKDCNEEVLAIPTIQKSRMDIVRIGPEVEVEKDRCLETFMEFAERLVSRLQEAGHWADFIDPCSGLPMKTPQCTRPYSEVAGFEHFLKFKTQNAGCCKVLLHPRWGSACYPATMFTTAPYPLIEKVLLDLDLVGRKPSVLCS